MSYKNWAAFFLQGALFIMTSGFHLPPAFVQNACSSQSGHSQVHPQALRNQPGKVKITQFIRNLMLHEEAWVSLLIEHCFITFMWEGTVE